MKVLFYICFSVLFGGFLFGESFDKIKLNRIVNVDSIDMIQAVMTNDSSEAGIIFKSDGEIKFYTKDFDSSLENIYINDRNLGSLFNEIVSDKIKNTNDRYLIALEESFAHRENPLWGKKLSIVGDSEAYGSDSYGNVIGARNNMTVINKSVGGTALVGSKESNALFPNYKDWIDPSSDYIIVQIGCNDGSTWNVNEDNESTNTNSFKGAWNVFLQNLKNEYPRAKKAIIMPYYWNTNYGRDVRVAWMKTRCDKYMLEYIDGVEELGFSPSTKPQYFKINDDGTPNQYHFNSFGHARASYVYEFFLKTRVQISK